MGTMDRGGICTTDGANANDSPGYFGHIALARPVYHIGFIKTVIRVLRCVSYHTSRLLVDKVRGGRRGGEWEGQDRRLLRVQQLPAEPVDGKLIDQIVSRAWWAKVQQYPWEAQAKRSRCVQPLWAARRSRPCSDTVSDAAHSAGADMPHHHLQDQSRCAQVHAAAVRGGGGHSTLAGVAGGGGGGLGTGGPRRSLDLYHPSWHSVPGGGSTSDWSSRPLRADAAGLRCLSQSSAPRLGNEGCRRMGNAIAGGRRSEPIGSPGRDTACYARRTGRSSPAVLQRRRPKPGMAAASRLGTRQQVQQLTSIQNPQQAAFDVLGR